MKFGAGVEFKETICYTALYLHNIASNFFCHNDDKLAVDLLDDHHVFTLR